eukprot:snap_masked-scaffold1806_size27391-processed-gene-0.4 protein:Tk09564 transcript:snap_masked-scaffold1806_size27391-processed-gene-0.4-mRNA-1 annotation:"actin-related protein 10"
MPFYEGIGLIAEKNAVVIELGAAYTKVGYAGEATPRAILPTPPLPAHADPDGLYDALFTFLHRIYFRHLLVNPRDRRVVVLDPLLGGLGLKNGLSRVLFQHFEALSILYAPSVLMPLLGLGLATGLVLDCGYEEAAVMPVGEGVPEQPVAPADLTPAVIEDVQVRLCFVSALARGRQIQALAQDGSEVPGLSSFLAQSVPPATYPLPGYGLLHVDGPTREGAAEVMFEPDDDGQTLPSLVLDSILASPIALRRGLAENVIVVGGTSMLLGFKARLFEEIKDLIQNNNYYNDKLGAMVDDFRLHVPPTAANYTSWTGASIFGATDAISTRSYTREMFVKDKTIPDWSDFRFNQLYVDEKSA